MLFHLKQQSMQKLDYPHREKKFDFEAVNSENMWYNFQNVGTRTRTSERAYDGEYSMLFEGRTQTWHSPAYRMYTYIRNRGSGLYRIGMWIYVTEVNPFANQVRLIVRGNSENSFIRKVGNNYFHCPMTPVTIQENKWKYLTCTIRVQESDIVEEEGMFDLMIDLLGPTEGQKIYFDYGIIRKIDDTKQDIIAKAYYDQGLIDYYGSETRTRNLIESTINNLMYDFKADFALNSVSYDVLSYTSLMDECTHTKNSQGKCTNSESCTKLQNIRDEFVSDVGKDWSTVKILFNGQDTWYEKSYGSYLNRSFCNPGFSGGIIMIAKERGQALRHEFSHALGANDHYHDNGEASINNGICENKFCSICADVNERRPLTCLMYDSDYYDIKEEQGYYCDACRVDIICGLDYWY